jgi:phenylalanine-4-hydroxylase
MEFASRPDKDADRTKTAYQQRRAEIAQHLKTTEEASYIPYEGREDEVWKVVTTALVPVHEKAACSEFLAGAAALALGREGVPQLPDVSEELERLSGFRLRATGGIAPPSQFYSVLAERRFLAAQFVRDTDSPFFSEEPDVLHELVGHANALANCRIAEIYESAGRAFVRLETARTIDAFSKLFWFTFETGVVQEGGRTKAFGAALLSSPGELGQLTNARLRPVVDLIDLVLEPYDITTYQSTLFTFDSFEHLEETLLRFFERCDEEFMTQWLSNRPLRRVAKRPTVPLDRDVACRVVEFFTEHPPPWLDDYVLPPRAPVALAYAAITRAGYDYDEIAAAFNYAESTPKTYIRDVAKECVGDNCRERKEGLELLAHAHLARGNPELLAKLIRTDVLRPRYPRAS